MIDETRVSTSDFVNATVNAVSVGAHRETSHRVGYEISTIIRDRNPDVQMVRCRSIRTLNHRSGKTPRAGREIKLGILMCRVDISIAINSEKVSILIYYLSIFLFIDSLRVNRVSENHSKSSRVIYRFIGWHMIDVKDAARWYSYLSSNARISEIFIHKSLINLIYRYTIVDLHLFKYKMSVFVTKASITNF